MTKEITITNVNNYHSFISFRINGLKDGITVGIVPDPNSHGQALSVAYKGEVKIVPLNATTEDLEELNSDENIIKPSRLKESDIIDSKLSGPVNATFYPLKTEWEIKADDKITTTLSMDKETYDWLTTPSEDDDVGCWCPEQVTELDEESFDKFAKEVYNKEVDTEKVEAAKKIFEGIDKVDVKIED